MKDKRVRFDDYMVHFDWDQTWIWFQVYAVQDWHSLSDKTKGTSYFHKETGEQVDVFDKDTCQTRFGGMYCWRGVWEGRIHFTDDEYWSDELRELADLFDNKIEPFCKDFIKSQDPHNYYDE